MLFDRELAAVPRCSVVGAHMWPRARWRCVVKCRWGRVVLFCCAGARPCDDRRTTAREVGSHKRRETEELAVGRTLVFAVHPDGVALQFSRAKASCGVAQPPWSAPSRAKAQGFGSVGLGV